MVIVSYDISNNKLRTEFAKYLSRFGHRLQYSVFEIDASERLLNVIESDIRNIYKKRLTQDDSVIIMRLSKSCKITRYGYAENDTKGLIII